MIEPERELMNIPDKEIDFKQRWWVVAYRADWPKGFLKDVIGTYSSLDEARREYYLIQNYTHYGVFDSWTKKWVTGNI